MELARRSLMRRLLALAFIIISGIVAMRLPRQGNSVAAQARQAACRHGA